LSATSLVDLDDETLDSAHGSGNETVMPQHAARQSGGEGGAGASSGDGNADIVRMANNFKGRAELKGFRSLDVPLKFHGNSIEEGIRMYDASKIDGWRVWEYGLEESRYDLWHNSTKVAGKKTSQDPYGSSAAHVWRCDYHELCFALEGRWCCGQKSATG